MDGYTPNNSNLASKIARLVEEKGWNQEDFARIANLNRHTVRGILKHGETRRLRNATVSQCALAFGLQVNELRNLPLETLLERLNGKSISGEASSEENRASITHPELQQWMDRNRDRADQLSSDELRELLSLQAPDGPFTGIGVEHFVHLLERKRKLLMQVKTIASTQYLGFLEQLVEMVYERAVRG